MTRVTRNIRSAYWWIDIEYSHEFYRTIPVNCSLYSMRNTLNFFKKHTLSCQQNSTLYFKSSVLKLFAWWPQNGRIHTDKHAAIWLQNSQCAWDHFLNTRFNIHSICSLKAQFFLQYFCRTLFNLGNIVVSNTTSMDNDGNK